MRTAGFPDSAFHAQNSWLVDTTLKPLSACRTISAWTSRIQVRSPEFGNLRVPSCLRMYMVVPSVGSPQLQAGQGLQLPTPRATWVYLEAYVRCGASCKMQGESLDKNKSFLQE